MKTVLSTALTAVLALAATGLSTPAARAAEANLDCTLSFSLTGWSLIYKHAEGEGVVNCENGASLPVKIDATGGGLTAGKFHVDDGKGRFTDVHGIDDVLGRYVQAEAHAGLVKSGNAQVLSKGTVSLVLAGSGEGVDLGIGVGAFTISRR